MSIYYGIDDRITNAYRELAATDNGFIGLQTRLAMILNKAGRQYDDEHLLTLLQPTDSVSIATHSVAALKNWLKSVAFVLCAVSGLYDKLVFEHFEYKVKDWTVTCKPGGLNINRWENQFPTIMFNITGRNQVNEVKFAIRYNTFSDSNLYDDGPFLDKQLEVEVQLLQHNIPVKKLTYDFIEDCFDHVISRWG